MPRGTKITPELISGIEADYKAGMIQTDIIAKHHISYKKLKDILKLPAGTRTFRVHYSREAVREDYRNGFPIKEIMKRHNIKSYANVYAIISKEKKRTKEAKRVWKETTRTLPEPECPIILRLRDRYRNYEQNTKDMGQSELSGNLMPLITVQPRTKYLML